MTAQETKPAASSAPQTDGRGDGPTPRTPAEQRSPVPAGGNQASPTGNAVSPAELARQLLESVPDRPRLAPGVDLAGQMRESAFVDPPWLLEQQGEGYVQVTHLLYLIAEQCDGQQSLGDIAARVSETYGRTVSPDNVRQLVATQLLAKGLVVAANGKVVPHAAGANRAALRINMRTKELPPSAIEPLTAITRLAFLPPVLLVILLAAAAVEGWIYLVHGVGASVHDAMYVPGFMAVVLLVIVLSAGFHELGHASALRYGGGHVKGMGAGMYLVYPAFYTDVSDNYRLPRWSRVRTDLGGFYFNLIFALVIMGLFVVLRQEALLLIITLMNFEIIHQLMPFLRLDGYWTLADATGVPDFFSQMGAFARSVLPGHRDGRKLPELKWWGKLVFGLYMLVTIPILVLLLFVMVKSVPRILATAWDALGQQGQGFAQAQHDGAFLGMAGAGLQAVLVLLPILGLVYTLYSLGRTALTLAWNWSKPSAGRRVLAALGGVAAAALLVALWAPQLPFAVGGRPRGIALSDSSFTPIGAQERFTLLDAATDAIATQTPLFGETQPTPEANATAMPEPTTDPAVSDGAATPSTTSTPAPTLAALAVGTPATPSPQSLTAPNPPTATPAPRGAALTSTSTPQPVPAVVARVPTDTPEAATAAPTSAPTVAVQATPASSPTTARAQATPTPTACVSPIRIATPTLSPGGTPGAVLRSIC